MTKMDKSNIYSRKKIFVFDAILMALLIAADQVIKYFVSKNLNGSDPIVLIPNALEFDYLENRGSAFGMLQNQKVFILMMPTGFLVLLTA